MNDIWESLEAESSQIESPNWHKDILEKRIEKIKKNQVNYLSLEELKSI
jgi:putative addiction module component (TIGR02574 family)